MDFDLIEAIICCILLFPWIYALITGFIDFFSRWIPKKILVALLIGLGIFASVSIYNHAQTDDKEEYSFSVNLPPKTPPSTSTNNSSNKNNYNSSTDDFTIDWSSESVYITATGKKYHRNGCRYLWSSKIEISLDKAIKRGYDPCSVCDP